MTVDHFYCKHPFFADLDSKPSNPVIVFVATLEWIDHFSPHQSNPLKHVRMFFSIKLCTRNYLAPSILVINLRISNKFLDTKIDRSFSQLTIFRTTSSSFAHSPRHHCFGALLGTISRETATSGWLGTISGKLWRTALGTISAEWLGLERFMNNQRGMVVGTIGETFDGLEQSAGKWWLLQRRFYQR